MLLPVADAVALTLALSGTYAALAAVSAISRLIVYLFTCGATLRLRQPQFAGRVRPPTFVVPGGPLVPSLAIVIALAILAGATGRQLRAGIIALAAGAVLYLIALRTTPAQAKK